jgi:hypothetical protein
METITLPKFIQAAFDDGTLAVQRTPESLLEVLNAREGGPSDRHFFLVTADDGLNELAPVEVLAGQRLAVQAQFGVHPSQQRYLDLSLEERVAKVIHSAKSMELPF